MVQVLSWERVSSNLYKGRLSALPPSKRSFTYRGKKLPIDPNLLYKVAKGMAVSEGTSAIAIENGIPVAYIYTAHVEPINLSVWDVAEDNSTLGNVTNWSASNGWANGAPFNAGWRAENLDITNGILSLTLTNTPASGYPYSSAEYRSSEFYGYGRYEAVMKTAAGAGLMNGFFSYTGVTDNGNPHDEIDIEVAGSDPTTLRTNYWVKGTPNESLTPLGFDSSADFHTYAFEWKPNSIEWFVDGRSVRLQQGGTLPSHAMRLMANLWSGDASANSWLGTFTYTNPVAAQFKSINFTPFVYPPQPILGGGNGLFAGRNAVMA